MKFSSKKIHSFGKIFGGKNRYARKMIKVLPDVSNHRQYIEPFCGGAGILMNKVRSETEVISDIDINIFRVLRTLRDNGPKLKQYLNDNYFNYTLENFVTAQQKIGHKNEVTHSAAYIAANRMSRTGLMKSFATSDRLRGGQMGDKNAWENYIQYEIDYTASRLQGVSILNTDAFTVLKKFATCDDTLVYLDPPYLHSTRVSKKAYLHEFASEDHERLLKLIKTLPAKIFISGYNSDLYQDYLKGWKIYKFNQPSDSGMTKVKTRRVEYLWESQ